MMPFQASKDIPILQATSSSPAMEARPSMSLYLPFSTVCAKAATSKPGTLKQSEGGSRVSGPWTKGWKWKKKEEVKKRGGSKAVVEAATSILHVHY